MYRIYENRVQEWIDNSRKALLIYGARQVGKTWLIREMLERNKINYSEINLLERPDILKMLENTDDSSEISTRLALYSEKELKEGESVIFLDEIQKYPDIVTKIKFLVDEGRFRYILSGSNLGVELKGIRSIPVGYIDEWQMMPMNFEEFAKATGVTVAQLEHTKACIREGKPVDEIIHKKLISTFYYYLVVGGMPAVVNVFNRTQNLDEIDKEQKNIVNQYKADFTRYEQEDKKLKVRSVYENIPSQLDKQNRRFTFTLLDRELKFDRYEDSFLWLKDAAVAIPSYIVSVPRSPLKISSETNIFRLFMSDVGLLVSCYPMFTKRKLLEMDPEKEINNGALFENFVAQEICAAGLDPYYYKKSKIGEVDFIIEREDGVIPIEVKSGSDYKKHAALDNLLEKESFKEVYVLSTNNIEKDNGINYYPIYAAGMICRPAETVV